MMAWRLACRAKWSTASDGGKAKLSGASANLTRADNPKRFLNILRFFTSSRTLCEVGKRNYFGAFVNLVALGTVFYVSSPVCLGIKDFIEGNAKECAPCSLFFCIGEKWPDPQCKPLEKKLIAVEVRKLSEII